jgi:hypothetical protein
LSISYAEAAALIAGLARMSLSGETGAPFQMPGDDAIATLDNLIGRARQIQGMSPAGPPPPGGVWPGAVVADLTDGNLIWAAGDGVLFTEAAAGEFAAYRNEGLREPRWRAFRLTSPGTTDALPGPRRLTIHPATHSLDQEEPR